MRFHILLPVFLNAVLTLKSSYKKNIMFSIMPGETMCFLKNVGRNKIVKVKYQVMESERVRSNMSISMDVRTRSGVITAQQGSAGARKIATSVGGQYRVCFDNSEDLVNKKTILFNLQIHSKRNRHHKKIIFTTDEELVKRIKELKKALRNTKNKKKHDNNENNQNTERIEKDINTFDNTKRYFSYNDDDKNGKQELKTFNPHKEVKESFSSAPKTDEAANCNCARHSKNRISELSDTKHLNSFKMCESKNKKNSIHADVSSDWAFNYKTEEVTNTLAHIKNNKDVIFVPISEAEMAKKEIENEVAMPNDESRTHTLEETEYENNVMHLQMEHATGTKGKLVLNRDPLELKNLYFEDDKNIELPDSEPTRTTEILIGNVKRVKPSTPKSYNLIGADNTVNKRRQFYLDNARSAALPTIKTYKVVFKEHKKNNKMQDKAIENSFLYNTRQSNKGHEDYSENIGFQLSSDYSNDYIEKSERNQRSDDPKDSMWRPLPYKWDKIF